jgi:3-oxoadipate enol-lactonase
MQFTTCNNITIHYEFLAHRHPKPTIVFINSLGTDFRIWDDAVPHFSANYNVLRYDKRGHGLSSAPDEPYTHALFSQDLIALLDTLGLLKVILVGNSIGGQIALNTAIEYPACVSTLVLSDTAAKLGTDGYWNQRIDAVKTQGLDGMAETILSRWFAPDFAEKRPAEYAGYRNLLERQSVVGYTSSCMALRDGDLRDDLHKIYQPALVLCGAEDTATPPDVVRQLAESLPNASFDLIENAGHTPCVEAPELLSQKILAFLESAD